MGRGWDRFRAGATELVADVNSRVAPIAKVISEAGPVLMELKGATSPLGILTAAATGLNAANGWFAENKYPGGNGPIGTQLFPWSEGIGPQLIEIFDVIAADQWDTDLGFRRWQIGDVVVQLAIGEVDSARVYQAGPRRKMLGGAVGDSYLKNLRAAIRAQFAEKWPGSTEIAVDSETPERTVFRIAQTDPLPSPRASEILTDTLPMIPASRPGRCIMLTGEPGGGKTSMAAWLARAVRDQTDPTGRIVHLRPDLAEMDDTVIALVLDIIRPLIVLVDDIDKLEDELPNRVLETIRTHAALTILTANNGLDERVMDGSSVRCGRIDETFEIDRIGVELLPSAALEKLPPDQWEDVRQWPAAFQEELVRRISIRGPERLNLAEMEHRIGMLVHSGGRIFREPDQE